MRNPIQWTADADCASCGGTGFLEQREYVEDSEGRQELDDIFRVICVCVELVPATL